MFINVSVFLNYECNFIGKGEGFVFITRMEHDTKDSVDYVYHFGIHYRTIHPALTLVTKLKNQ